MPGIILGDRTTPDSQICNNAKALKHIFTRIKFCRLLQEQPHGFLLFCRDVETYDDYDLITKITSENRFFAHNKGFSGITTMQQCEIWNKHRNQDK